MSIGCLAAVCRVFVLSLERHGGVKENVCSGIDGIVIADGMFMAVLICAKSDYAVRVSASIFVRSDVRIMEAHGFNAQLSAGSRMR
jgi:hypothetical protein